jgi:hypothetical protein
MGVNYVPRKTSLYWGFSNHFVEVISKRASEWGITIEAKTQLVDDHKLWVEAQNDAENPNTRTSISIEKAHRLRVVDTKNIRWIVNTFINPNVLGTITQEDRLDLGLSPKDGTITHHPAPTSRPITEVKPSGMYELMVTANNSATGKKTKPADAHGVRYAWQLGGEPPANPEELPKSLFSKKTSKKFAWEPNNQGTAIHYATAYENDKGDVGKWSAIISTIIP